MLVAVRLASAVSVAAVGNLGSQLRRNDDASYLVHIASAWSTHSQSELLHYCLVMYTAMQIHVYTSKW